MHKWKPIDVIALVVIVGAFVLRCRGIDSYVSWALVGVVAGYFGVKIPITFKNRNNKEGD